MAPFSNPLLVTDAPHLLYRAFFALPDSIKGADGHPVNALLGSVNQTLWCVERYKPRAVVMFDMVKGMLTGSAAEIAETKHLSGRDL